MRAIFTLLLIVLAVVAAVHLYLYLSVGTVEPCRAAVLRIIQKQRDKGNDVVANLGVVFRQQAEDLLRSEGIATCYRSAFTGEAPEQLTVKFQLPR